MRYAIARILEGKTSAPETQFLGTAFAVSDELALTAFHCIGDRSSNRVSLDRVKLLFPDNELVDAEYRGGDGRLDYAVLRLQLAPSKSLTRVSITPDTFREEQFFSSGYPAQIIETEFFTVTGVVSDPGAALRGDVPAIQLFSRESAARLSLQGMSGAPVMVGDPPAAIGIVRWNPVLDQDPTLAAGGSFFACPVQAILEREPELAGLAIKRAPEQKMADAIRSWRSAPEELRDILKVELERMNRQKVSEAQYQRLESGWISLPNYRFSSPVPDTQEAVAAFIKAMLRVVALGTAEIFPSPVQELQFVMLCRWNREGEDLNFVAYLPFQELVGFALDHLPPRMESSTLARAFRNKPVDVHHNYAFPIDTLCPIVAVCRPILKHVQFANRNQFAAPDQFLDPNTCRTTSGFLNFLGTHAIKRAGSDPNELYPLVYRNVEHLLDAGLEQWFRWLYHVMDCGIWETERIFVSSANPEEYAYRYNPGRGES